MGFFSDLKEDLSQAVNELMPEETKEEQPEPGEKETEGKEAETLASMLDKLEAEEQAANESVAEEAVEPGNTEEEQTEEDTPDLQEAYAPDTELTEEIDAIITEAEEKNNNEIKGEKRMDEQVFGVNETASDEKSVITEGMTINGDIVSRGSMDVLGSIIGNIDILGKLDVSGNVQGNSKAAEVYAENAKIVGEVHSMGSVKIGQSTVIIGDITASSAVIAGAIKGDIDVKGPVILDTSAIVMGNIKSKSVQINNGAVVEGLCSQCYADVNPSAFFDEFKKTAKA
ncbi:MAG: polymer-forming cytoskeletal protein [Lachnospiraceae bacterium]